MLLRALRCGGPTAGSVRSTPASARTIFNFAKGFAGVFGKTSSLAGSRPLLKPGKIAPKLVVPDHIKKPPYADTGAFPKWSDKPQIHDDEGIKRMRASGNLAARVLQYAGSLIKPGVTTDEIDQAVHAMIIANNAYPSPLNYGAFPKSVCTSVNECVCHGIPDDRPLQDGDIVNVDVTVYLDGYHGDTSSMFYVGEVSPEAKRLCETTKRSLEAAIKECKPGAPYARIGKVIHAIADEAGFGVVREYVGHGVGTVFHSSPTIQHYRNTGGGVMMPWQTFTIEPMLVQGSPKLHTWKDKWTVVTADGGLTAQYEHTLLITPDGAEILTTTGASSSSSSSSSS